MKLLIAGCAVAALNLAACASAPDVAGPDYDSSARFADVARTSPLASNEEFSPRPGEPITVDFLEKRLPPGFNPVKGLERMPFGRGMFGPWDVGGTGPNDTGAPGRFRTLSDVEHETLGEKLGWVLAPVLRGTGLQVIFEDDTSDVRVHAAAQVPADGFTRAEALSIVRSICDDADLDCIVGENVVLIRKRPPHIVPGSIDGLFDVAFTQVALVDAILETANVTHQQVFVPAILSQPTKRDATKKVSLTATGVTPDYILRELARLGDMDIEVIALEDAAPGFEQGYMFKYKK
ncbi:MAG: hypothetical protein H6839_10405 [Planctomycetes bacterium]|nr:hypothetical protein [Planctomycetota bacterium]